MNGQFEIYRLKVFDLSSNKITEHELITEQGVHPVNKNIIWSVKFDFYGESIKSQNQYFLSEAVNEIRKIIEPKGYRMLIRCSDYDAAHSGMQADMSAGTKIYKLNEINDKGKFISFDIFEESDIKSVATLADQKKYTEKILKKIKKNKNDS